MIRQRRNTDRRGFTLIEVVLALSLVGGLLTGILGVLSLVQQSERSAGESVIHLQSIRRFADDVRRDVHECESLQLQKGQLQCALEDSKLVTYEIQSDNVVTRTLRVDLKTMATETYHLFEAGQVDLQSIDDGRAILCTISDSQRPQRPYTILASRRPIE